MLNFIPLACSRRKVTNRDGQTCLVCHFLQFNLPQPITSAIASATIRSYQKMGCLRVSRTTHLPPPLPNGSYRKRSRVVIDTNTDPAVVPRQIINPVGRYLTRFLVYEIMNANFFRITLWMPFPPCILEIAYQFLLLGIYRNNRLPPALLPSRFLVDVVELRIPVWMLLSFGCLAIRLKTVIHVTQKRCHRTVADLVPLPTRRPGEPTDQLLPSRRCPEANRAAR